MADATANNSWGTVLTAPSPATSGTSLVLNAGQGAKMPTAPFNAKVVPAGTLNPYVSDGEIIRVTARSTNTLTISRAQESSAALAIAVGDFVMVMPTKKTFDDIEASKQPIDSDLTAIAALTPTNDDVIQRKAGAWTNRTPSQVKTDLVLVKGDVGLGNVDNTSDANKPVSTATQTALNGKENSFTKGDIVAGTNITLGGTLTSRLVGTGNVTINAPDVGVVDAVLAGDGVAVDATDPANPIVTADVLTVNGQTSEVVITATDVGLGNVDNTSNATERAATATLTNKTLTSPVINTGVSGTAIDTDPALTADSDTLIASQKATKAWAQSAAGYVAGLSVAKATLTTKGDIYIATGASTVVRQPVGTNTQRLVADSTQTNGVRWESQLIRDSMPTGAITQTIPRWFAMANLAVLTSGTLRLESVMLEKNEVINAISWVARTTALSGASNQWFALFDTNRLCLAVTNDDGATAWGANARKTLNLTTPYTVPSTGHYYIGVMVNATTVPTLSGIAQAATSVTALAPIYNGNSSAALTTPFTVGATAAALTGSGSGTPYAYLS